MVEKIRFFDDKKFLWDGEEYESEEKAVARQKEYLEKDFEVQMYSEDDKVFLYTRRVVTEVVVDQS